MIQSVSTRDARFPIGHGNGSDATRFTVIRSIPMPSPNSVIIVVTLASVWLSHSAKATNSFARRARFYAQRLIGKPVEDIMAQFGDAPARLGGE